MTYHLVLFEKPESLDYTGPQKWRISKVKFERVCDPSVTMVQLDDAMFRLDDKKIFSIERWNNGVEETIHSIIVCEAHKMKPQ